MSVHMTLFNVSNAGQNCKNSTYFKWDASSGVVSDNFGNHVDVPIAVLALVKAKSPVGIHLRVANDVCILLGHLGG